MKRTWGLAFLLFAVPACSDDEEFLDFSGDEDEKEAPGPPQPGLERAAQSADCIDYYGGSLPRLIDLLVFGDAERSVLPWPGGFLVDLSVQWTNDTEVRFSNDSLRDGYLFRGHATVEWESPGVLRVTGGVVEFQSMGPCDLTLGDWDLAFDPRTQTARDARGKVRLNPGLDTNAQGSLQFVGDGTAFFSGSYTEPGTVTIPVQFTVPLDG